MQNDMDYSDKSIAFGGSSHTSLGRALVEAFAQHGATTIQVEREASLSPGAEIDALVWVSPSPAEAPFLQLSDSDWTGAIQTGLLSSARLIREIGEGMVARQRGCVIVVGSLSGTTGWPGFAVSSMVEGGLIALVRSLACEWAVHNVRLVYLAYGAVDGIGAAQTAERATQLAARTPLGQIARPEQIASVALYLAGPRASFTTGSVVRADGGWTAWGLLK